MQNIITLFLVFLAIYFLIGIIFGIFFIFKGAQKLDSTMKKSSLTMKLIIYPGAVCLWLILLIKLFKSNT